ncbi:unannotated protein [freshwater metagenome]|uniref:Unannotated protein n=1 Tax=freshwater metagenome TaxID=449393 RepID=A0A6J6JHS3_9ZZZZ
MNLRLLICGSGQRDSLIGHNSVHSPTLSARRNFKIIACRFSHCQKNPSRPRREYFTQRASGLHDWNEISPTNRLRSCCSDSGNFEGSMFKRSCSHGFTKTVCTLRRSNHNPVVLIDHKTCFTKCLTVVRRVNRVRHCNLDHLRSSLTKHLAQSACTLG